jgi:hypothetical protein
MTTSGCIATAVAFGLIVAATWRLNAEARRTWSRRPRSLRRLAKQRAIEELGGRWSRRRIAAVASRLAYQFRRGLEQRAAPLLVIGLLVGLAWIPIPASLFGMTPTAAGEFLAVLWQALAGAVGLSVAVVLFALQSASTTRSVSLTELASRSGLLLVVYIGVAALLDVGVALLPLHHGGANGWPGLLATLASGVAITSVAIVFLTSLRLTDPRVLRHHRISDLRMEARARVHRSVISRIAAEYLEGHASELRIDVKRWLPYVKHDLEVVKARRDGVIYDIRLKRLRSLTTAVPTSEQPLALAMTLGEQVSRGTPLMFLPKPTGGRWREDSDRIYVVRRGRPDRDGLRDAVAGLHQEALEAIRDSRPTQYVEIRDAQEELLLAFPRAWREAGFQYEDDAESRAFGLSGPIDRVRQNMYEQATRAASAEEREIGFAAGYSPLAVAAQAWELRATTLLSSMLAVSVSIFDSTSRYQAPHFGALMHEGVQRHILEFLDFRLCRHLDDDEPLNGVAALVEVASQTNVRVASLSRISVESRRLELLRSGLRHWRQILEYANPRDPDLAAAQRQIEIHRTGCMVAVAAWALRLAMADPSSAKSQALLVTAAYARWETGDDPIIFSIADGVLSEWISSDMPERVTYSVDAQTPIHRLLAFRLLTEASAVPLVASSWVQDRKDSLFRAVDELAGASQLWVALGSAAPALDAVHRAKQLIDQTVTKYAEQEAERLRAAPIPAGAVDSIRLNLRQGWEEDRWLPRWLAVRGLTSTEPVNLPTTRFGVEDLILKSFFLDERFVGVDQSLRHLGRAIAAGERQQVAEALNRAPRQRQARTGLRARVEAASAALASRGNQPVVFIPINWQVRDALGLGFERLRTGSDGLELGHAFAGQINGTPVIELHDLKKVVVADPVAYLRWESWPIEGEDLSVVVTEFDATEADEQVRRNRKLMYDEVHRSIADRAAKLRTYVWVTAYEGFAIGIQDPHAAVSVIVPAAIRGD